MQHKIVAGAVVLVFETSRAAPLLKPKSVGTVFDILFGESFGLFKCEVELCADIVESDEVALAPFFA